MNTELILTLIKLFNVIFCFSLVALILWHNIKNKVHSNSILIFSISLLFIQIGFTIIETEFEIISVSLTLFILLISLLNFKKLSKQSNLSYSNQPDDLIEQAKDQERSRIYANLHDDVGAKLLELIYTAKDEESKNLAKQVLSDIRQAVASTVNIQCNVNQLAQEIVDESKMRLNSVNINLEYHSQINNPNHNLALTVPIVIGKICREVVSNIIKHANASKVDIIIISSNKNLKIKIVDNGKGFSQNNQSGKGLKTINKRAQSISSMVEWNAQPNKGTEFSLIYPYGNH